MRRLLTERGGFTFCVSEFLRVSQDLLPPRVFFDHLPELKSASRTHSGVPVQIQILGGDAGLMAATAARAVELGAEAVDINFGCPAPTVNRHDGGAAILRTPSRVREITAAVRAAVPSHLPVSAKLRLGWECMDDIFVNAEQAALGGASWITIHARTKTQGYAPPAHWHYIAEVKKRLTIPVVANGEIWTLEDFRRCRDITGCEHFMIGRGALGDPALPHAVARELGLPLPQSADPYPHGRTPDDWRPLLRRFGEIYAEDPTLAPDTPKLERALLARMKQWLRYANFKTPLPWFDAAKRTQSVAELMGLT